MLESVTNQFVGFNGAFVIVGGVEW
jgi:hypothetical protein